MALNHSQKSFLPLLAIGLFTVFLCGTTACKNDLLGEAAVVIPERMEVRNSISRVSKTIGELKRGDQVTIVERSTQAETAYARIKTADGTEGWADARNLARKANLDQAQELAASIKDHAPQAECRARASIKVRLTPSRINDDNVIALLPKDTMFDAVDRDNLPKAQQAAGDDDKEETKGAKYEVWYKVRVKDNPVVPAGYVYGGSVELAVPQEIVYFAHPARKIVGWQKLGTVKDDRGQDNFHYVVFQKAYNNADEKSDFDYFQVVGFDPNAKSVSYYHVMKKEIRGIFPVAVKLEDKRATFDFKSLDSNNQETPAQFMVTEERGHLRAPRPDAPPKARK